MVVNNLFMAILFNDHVKLPDHSPFFTAFIPTAAYPPPIPVGGWSGKKGCW
jgi:hypothetical protein